LSWKRSRVGPKHIYQLAKKWKNYLRETKALQLSLKENNYFEVYYEELVSNPVKISVEICNFLGEEYDPRMLSFHEQHTSYPTDNRNQDSLAKPIMSKNKNKWRKDMTMREVHIFEAVAGSTLEEYGYEKTLYKPSVSFLDIILYKYVEHPPKKLWSMLKNRKGQIDALRRLKIYFRLILRL